MKGVSYTIFDEFPQSNYYITFKTECKIGDTSQREVNCVDSDGFLPKFLTGLVGGEREAKSSILKFNIEVDVPEPFVNYIGDLTVKVVLQAINFDINLSDNFVVFLNNKVNRKSNIFCYFFPIE